MGVRRLDIDLLLCVCWLDKVIILEYWCMAVYFKFLASKVPLYPVSCRTLSFSQFQPCMSIPVAPVKDVELFKARYSKKVAHRACLSVEQNMHAGSFWVFLWFICPHICMFCFMSVCGVWSAVAMHAVDCISFGWFDIHIGRQCGSGRTIHCGGKHLLGTPHQLRGHNNSSIMYPKSTHPLPITTWTTILPVHTPILPMHSAILLIHTPHCPHLQPHFTHLHSHSTHSHPILPTSKPICPVWTPHFTHPHSPTHNQILLIHEPILSTTSTNTIFFNTLHPYVPYVTQPPPFCKHTVSLVQFHGTHPYALHCTSQPHFTRSQLDLFIHRPILLIHMHPGYFFFYSSLSPCHPFMGAFSPVASKHPH